MHVNPKYYNKEDKLKYFNLEEYLKYFIMEDNLKYFLKWNTISNIFANERQPQII